MGASVEFAAGENRGHRDNVLDFAVSPKGPPLLVIQLFDRHIRPDGSLVDAIADPLRQLQSEFALNLSATPISRSGIRQVAHLDSLVGLNLELCPRIDNAALEALNQADNLRTLIAVGNEIGPAGLAHIAELPTLYAVDLEICDSITDDSCRQLARMTDLRALVLRKTGFESNRISARGLSMLAGLQHLELLNLYGNAITDESLKHLSEFRKLRVLDLSLTPITDVGLHHLTTLDQLTHLTLLYSEGFAGPKVTNDGVKSLSSLHRLSHLNLVGAQIDDDSIDSLMRLQSLRQLNLIDTGFTAGGMQQLREAFPDATISFDDASATIE